jgi:hypothetical protein
MNYLLDDDIHFTFAYSLSLGECLATDQIQVDKAGDIQVIQYELDLYALPTGSLDTGQLKRDFECFISKKNYAQIVPTRNKSRSQQFVTYQHR